MIKKPEKPKSPKRHYLVVVWGDVEPCLRGPFARDATRLAAARKHRREEGEENDTRLPYSWPTGSLAEVAR